jgi:GDPmannose 4,6-dehydratase
MAQGLDECLYMGNINALRDWGHAKDYVEMQWLMLQQDKPEDFVIATGVQYSVRQFIEWSALELGITLRFDGEGLNEVGIVESIKGDDAPALKVGDVIIRIDSTYYRCNEVNALLGNIKKAEKILKWKPTITAHELCVEMVQYDLKLARENSSLYKPSTQ